MNTWIDQFKANLLEVLYRDQPRDELGRFASTGGAGATGPDDGTPASILAAEAEIAGNPKETGIVFDKDGNELFRVAGDETSVKFVRSERERMKDAILTHNHPPPENGLSLMDVQAMVATDLAEIRAVTEDNVYSLKPNPEWGTDDSPGKSVIQAHLTIESKATFKKHYQRLTKELVNSSTNSEELERRLMHDVVSELAPKFGMEYTRTPRK